MSNRQASTKRVFGKNSDRVSGWFMTWLILEMLLALGVIVGIMIWTLKTRTDTPLEAPQKSDSPPTDALPTDEPSVNAPADQREVKSAKRVEPVAASGNTPDKPA